ncbi:hypothetical protein ACFFRR_007900 [Megaselia abdita]
MIFILFCGSKNSNSRSIVKDKSSNAPDLYLVGVTIIAIVGALCFLGGLVILLTAFQDRKSAESQGILLSAMGFFVVGLCYINWKITKRRDLDIKAILENNV